jgi:UDP-glucose 4-epimerase
VKVVIFGGAGFVGLNVAETLLASGHEVVAFDRRSPPRTAIAAFSAYQKQFSIVQGDVTNTADVAQAIAPGIDAIVYGAAITADAARDAAEPERILAVNLAALPAVLRAAKDAKVRRIINLSSAGALGQATDDAEILHEALTPDPISLYSLTKFASERLVARLGDLWSLDCVNVRLSAVFGPWEHTTGVRDTISPPGQILALAERGAPALLSRPGVRDWVYALDVGAAVLAVLQAAHLPHRLYNITSGQSWPVLSFGQRLATLRPRFSCRLAEPGEAANVDLFMPKDRPPLSAVRLANDVGWRAVYGLDEAVAHLDGWSRTHGAQLKLETS